MKLDFASLAFGYSIRVGGGTPNWATALGQSAGYKINPSDDVNELLKGMIYKAVKPSNIKFKNGKGGAFVTGDSADSPLVIASVFDKVYINDSLIENGKFILLISKDTSKSHNGRLRLKYGPDNTYIIDEENTFKNSDFLNLARHQLGLSDDACWFVSHLDIKDQDKLFFKAVIVNQNASKEYSDSSDLHASWDEHYNAEEVNELKLPPANNILLYGVPGCGKSHTIKEDYCKDSKYMERTVFHPDYTYSDFVGQILPKTKKDEHGNDAISYIFTPGPFTRILKAANSDKSHSYYLIIEEINRGNAPAIFGDIFQLLDRYDEADKEDNPTINIGESAYSINNADIAKEVYGDDEHPVTIPANLFIIATMNTADQNVFTLDTDFKRRWKMKSIPNNIADCKHANNNICDRNVSWAEFATKINDRILEYGDGNLSSEDTRLGGYFVKANELNDSSAFAEKVLMYLWNDAFKFDREKIFKNKYRSLEELITAFKKDAFDVFVDNLNFDNSLVEKASPTDS